MLLSPRHNPLNLSIRSRPVSPGLAPSKRHLLSESPLPSPSLPSTLPRHGKKSTSRARRTLLRILIWFIGTLVLIYVAAGVISSGKPPAALDYLSTDGKAYDIVGQDDLPDFPTPLSVTDQRGREKWTVSIPADRDFPLKPDEYRQICMSAHDVSQHIEDMKTGNTEHKHTGHRGYYYNDPFYMDIGDAETHNLLPGLAGQTSSSKHDLWAEMLESDQAIKSISGSTSIADESDKVCSRSLTYVMETDSAGMGPTLLGLWLAYGLAQKENRAFFIDDTNWPYGSYTTYFKPPPRPSCLPPAKTQITPCPHQARHLLVSAATTSFTFGGAFNEEFEDPKKMEVFRQQPIFAMMRTGYEALFDLSSTGDDSDATYLASHVDSLNTTIRGSNGIEIGIHVRHGDVHPMEYQYRESYLPLSKYTDEARNYLYTWGDISGPNGEEDFEAEMASKFILGSDDPDAYSSVELSHALRAQDRILLASKTGEKTKPIAGVDERMGWEGGFFRDVFWSLGFPNSRRDGPVDSPRPSRRTDTKVSVSALASGEHPKKSPVSEPVTISTVDTHTHPSDQSLKLRELVGRAYLLDLAVLGQADAVVCGVSSYGCRILAVMMGWEKAIERRDWRNVDGEFDWMGLSW